MIPVKKVEMLLLTKELAAQHHATQGLPGEREIDPFRRKKLEQHLENGTFHSPSWALAEDEEGNLWRIDGQHSSELLASCDAVIFPAGLFVVRTIYAIESIAKNGAELFEMFNSPLSVRTNKEKMNYYRANHHDLLEVDPRFLVKACNGYHYYLNTLPLKGRPQLWDAREHGNYLNDPKLRSFILWLNHWEEWEEWVEEKGKKNRKQAPNRWMLGMSGIVAVMYGGWKMEPKVATQFWANVLLEDGDRNDASRRLSNTLNKWRNNKKEKQYQSDYHHQALVTWEQHLKHATTPSIEKDIPLPPRRRN